MSCAGRSRGRAEDARARATMNEYELYLPLHYNDGSAIDPEKIAEIKKAPDRHLRRADALSAAERGNLARGDSHVSRKSSFSACSPTTPRRRIPSSAGSRKSSKADLQHENILIVVRKAKGSNSPCPSSMIAGGTVYDPANGIDGVVQDIWIQDGKIIAAPDRSRRPPRPGPRRHRPGRHARRRRHARPHRRAEGQRRPQDAARGQAQGARRSAARR